MSASNYITQVYSRIWDLLTEYPDFAAAVAPGNRISLIAGRPMPFKTAKQDADFPEAILIASGGSESEWSRFKTYPAANPGAVAAAQVWIETWAETFVLAIQHVDLRLDNALALEAAALAALRLGGPRLGLPFVHQWGAVEITRQIGPGRSSVVGSSDRAGPDGTRRWSSEMRFNVVLRLDGQDELA